MYLSLSILNLIKECLGVETKVKINIMIEEGDNPCIQVCIYKYTSTYIYVYTEYAFLLIAC